MIENDRTLNDDAADDSLNETEGDAGGTGNVDSITPQGEASGNDPAGLEVSEAGQDGGGGAIGDRNEGGDSTANARGVGDWNPASVGGGGGELY